MPKYMTTEEAAEYCRLSVRSVLGRTTRGAIPHRRGAGCRGNLFTREDLDAWLDGAELKTIVTPSGGRIVRPISRSTVQ